MNEKEGAAKKPNGCLKIFLVIVLILFVWGWASWNSYVLQFYKDRAPQDSGVTNVTYYKEKSMGFGPGGNGFYIIVYGLNDHTLNDLHLRPDEFLNGIVSRDGSRHRCSIYADWKETPFNNEQTDQPMRFREYRDRYGFGHFYDVENSIESFVDAAFSSKGNFYAVGRCGMFVFVPSEGKAFFIHVG